MKRDTYLSIDLDYWKESNTTTGMVNFLKKVKQINPKPVVVKSHNELIHHVHDTKGVNRVVNVDYHSDITDLSNSSHLKKHFNEGTWINYINLKENSEYVWHYPHKDSCTDFTGYCHQNHNPFNKHSSIHDDFSWECVKKRKGLPSDAELARVKDVGICISPNWTGIKVLNHLYALAKLEMIDPNDITKLFIPDNKVDIHKLDREIFTNIIGQR